MLNKLCEMQSELKAPKNRFNSFGKYSYRSCEDILEAVKPLLKAKGCVLTVSDEIISLDGRFYVKATATITDVESKEAIRVNGYAREADDKKGQDQSQITGTASSYARKYALNGLFCIDDNKDADTDEYQHEKKSREAKAKPASKPAKSRAELEDEIKQLCLEKGKTIADVCNIAKVSSLADMNDERLQACIEWLAKFN